MLVQPAKLTGFTARSGSSVKLPKDGAWYIFCLFDGSNVFFTVGIPWSQVEGIHLTVSFFSFTQLT